LNPSTTLQAQLQNLVVQLVAGGLTLAQAKREFERQFLIAAMRANGGSIGRSASALGVHRNTMRNRLVSLKIQAAEYAPPRG
jgi:DNA-binding NtrC family response regulator